MINLDKIILIIFAVIISYGCSKKFDMAFDTNMDNFRIYALEQECKLPCKLTLQKDEFIDINVLDTHRGEAGIFRLYNDGNKSYKFFDEVSKINIWNPFSTATHLTKAITAVSFDLIIGNYWVHNKTDMFFYDDGRGINFLNSNNSVLVTIYKYHNHMLKEAVSKKYNRIQFLSNIVGMDVEEISSLLDQIKDPDIFILTMQQAVVSKLIVDAHLQRKSLNHNDHKITYIATELMLDKYFIYDTIVNYRDPIHSLNLIFNKYHEETKIPANYDYVRFAVEYIN